MTIFRASSLLTSNQLGPGPPVQLTTLRGTVITNHIPSRYAHDGRLCAVPHHPIRNAISIDDEENRRLGEAKQ
jgi:hypothetical protein